MKTRLGKLSKVVNQGKKHSEKSEYICVWVKDEAHAFPLLFTESELNSATERAYKNQEDITERSCISKLID